MGDKTQQCANEVHCKDEWVSKGCLSKSVTLFKLKVSGGIRSKDP